jgi:hypothetical protein
MVQVRPPPNKTRAAAAERLWQLALSDEAARVDLFRSNYVDIALRLLTTGNCQEQHVSAGLLVSMAAEGPHCNLDLLLQRVRINRIVPALTAIFLSHEHPRSKVWNHGCFVT